MKILTSVQTRKAEQIAFNMGISGERLMENAGSAAVRILREKYKLENLDAVVVVGQGNNGGDGYVVARKLREYGARVTVVMAMGISTTRDSSIMHKKAITSGVTVMNYYDNSLMASTAMDNADIIVDAIFGIGFHGIADRDISEIIEKINLSKAKKIALDIPSGVQADTGEVLGAAVKADLTISFIGYKPCAFEYPASEYCGEVSVVSIGIDDRNIIDYSGEIIDKKTALSFLKKIPKNAHKGVKGTALIIGGSFGMAGAPMISAKAAMRSGAGLVKVCTTKDTYPAAAPMLPEAVFVPKEGRDGFLSSEDITVDLFKNVNSLLIGPGMGYNDTTVGAVAKAATLAKVPTVVDADGLNAISAEPQILNSNFLVAITPHPGEMARLIGKSVDEIQKNRISTAMSFAKAYGVITVLKGAYTVVAMPSGRVYINVTGNEGMATAGSGDMLAGMIAAFLANGIYPENAVLAAVCLHGAAGDKTASKLGVRSILASDMIEQLPYIFSSGEL